MKPRLILIKGLWHCGVLGTYGVGVGFTPKQAYDYWVSAMQSETLCIDLN